MTDTDPGDADRHPRDDPERLRELYHEDGLSMPEIAERFGVSHQAVRWWMIRYDIDRRTVDALADSSANGPPYEHPYRDPDYLRVAYWQRGQTLSEIASTCGVITNTVVYWMRKHNIPRREAKPRSYHRSLRNNS